MAKTIRVSNENWQGLETIRQDMLREKMQSQIGNGKLERTDVTFDEVISWLLKHHT